MNQSVIVSRNSRAPVYRTTMYENLGLSEPNWVIINLSDTNHPVTPSPPRKAKWYVSTVPKASRRPPPNVVKLSAQPLEVQSKYCSPVERGIQGFLTEDGRHNEQQYHNSLTTN